MSMLGIKWKLHGTGKSIKPGHVVAPDERLAWPLTIGAPPVFLYEPHQTEMCEWKPDVLLDITPAWDKKRKAIEAMVGQEYLWDYYTRVALNRGVQAKRNSTIASTYAEGYQRLFNRSVVYSQLENGKVVPLTTEFEDVGDLALPPG